MTSSKRNGPASLVGSGPDSARAVYELVEHHPVPATIAPQPRPLPEERAHIQQRQQLVVVWCMIIGPLFTATWPACQCRGVGATAVSGGGEPGSHHRRATQCWLGFIIWRCCCIQACIESAHVRILERWASVRTARAWTADASMVQWALPIALCA